MAPKQKGKENVVPKQDGKENVAPKQDGKRKQLQTKRNWLQNKKEKMMCQRKGKEKEFQRYVELRTIIVLYLCFVG